jgi:hypothetical protein
VLAELRKTSSTELPLILGNPRYLRMYEDGIAVAEGRVPSARLE